MRGEVEGISQREFAKREGCSPTLVRQKIKSGHLKTLPNDKIDPALVGTPWKKSNQPVTIEDEAQSIIDRAVKIPPKAESEALKEYYISLLRQLEYDRAVGDVVLIEDVTKVIGEQFARVRTKLLGIASRIAPRAAPMKVAAEIKSLIDGEVAQALQELSLDGHGRVNPDNLTPALRERFRQAN